jgi:hypothetical protein
MPGKYLITGDYLPIQILESPLLAKSANLWLKSLRRGERRIYLTICAKHYNIDTIGQYTFISLYFTQI